MPRGGGAQTAVRTALIVSGLVLLAAVVVVLAQAAPRSAGSEDITSQLFVREVPPGERACLLDATVPAGTARVSAVLGTYGVPGGRVAVEAKGPGGQILVRGGLEPGWREGPILIPFGPVPKTLESVEVCFINRGDKRFAVGGEPGSPGERQLAVDYVRAGEETWFQTAPRVIDRFGHGKAALLGGGWTLWAALALVLAGWAVAARALLRAPRAR